MGWRSPVPCEPPDDQARADRKQLAGLLTEDPKTVLRGDGSHLVPLDNCVEACAKPASR